MADAACMNFRDVGEWLAVLAGREILPAQRLLRGGKLDLVRDPAEIGHPGTIVNLRMGPDRETFGAAHRQVAIPNAHEKYDTTDELLRLLEGHPRAAAQGLGAAG